MADSVKIKITGDASQFNKEVGSLGDKVKSAASGAGSVLKGMLGSQIITKGFSMLTGGIRSAITTGMEFEAAMSQVAAISGATAEELEQLTAAARHYGETTKYTASQAASALNYMALAGWSVEQSLDALPGVLSLAAASGMELGAASDAVTDYISAFGMEASDAAYMADLMAYAQANANTSAAQLADAYGNCASTMHAAGQDIETTTAMLMALSNQGIKGSEAGTQMAAIMRDITQKMENGRISIGQTSIAVTDAAGNFRDLNDIMADVGAAVDGMGTAERSAAIMTTFTARSVKAVNTILNESMENVDAYEDALRNSTGTATEQASMMMDNLQGDVQIFQSTLEGLQITAGESVNGIARALVQESTSILDAINRGGKQGGLSGMADALIDSIPQLLPKLLSGAEKLLGGVTAKLPSLVKKLGAALPNLLSSGLRLIPTLTDSLMTAAGAAVESIAANLPDFVAGIFAELPDILTGVFRGALSIVGGLFNGVDRAMAKMGLREWTLSEALQNQVDAVDPELTASLRAAADVEYTVSTITVDAEDIKTKVDAAEETIRNVLLNCGIDETTSAMITAAITSGSGYDALVAALAAMQLPDGRMDEIAGNLKAAFSTIESALSELDLSDEARHAAMQYLIGTAGAASIKAALLAWDVPPDEAEAAAKNLSESVSAIDDAVQALNLEPAREKALKEAAAGGAGKDAIQAMLTSWGMEDANAAIAAEAITTGVDAFEKVLLGIGLEEACANALLQAEMGYESTEAISAMLVSFGVPQEEAEAAANSLTEATGTINESLSGLSLDTQSVIAFLDGADADKAMLKAALNLLGLDDVDIESIVGSYATIEEYLGPKLSSLCQNLIASLTNGIPDDADKQFEAAKVEINSFLTNAKGVVDAWETDMITSLQNGSVTPEGGKTIEQAIADIQTQAATMKSDLEGMYADVNAWTEEMSGKPAAYVQIHIDELYALIEQIWGIDAAMASLDAGLVTTGAADRNAVEAGALTDYESQISAIAYTSKELEHALGLSTTQEKQELAKAAEEFGANTEAYAAQKTAVLAAAQAREERAYAAYNGHMSAILKSMVEDNPDLSRAVNEYKKNGDEITALTSFGDLLIAWVESGIDWDSLSDASNEINYDDLAAQLGLNAADLREAIENSIANGEEINVMELFVKALNLKGHDLNAVKEAGEFSDDLYDVIDGILWNDGYGLAQITTTIQGKIESLERDAARAIEGSDMGEVLAVLNEALKQGLLDGVDDGGFGDLSEVFEYIANRVFAEPIAIDTSVTAPVIDQAAQTAKDIRGAATEGMSDLPGETSEIGTEAGAGLAKGLEGQQRNILSVARNIALAVSAEFRRVLDVNSPSKVMERIGAFTGEGFGIGLEESLESAVRTAHSVVGLANLAPRMDFSGLSGAFGSAVQMLNEVESQRPTDVYINGRLVARTMERDSAQASAAFSRRIGLGYGK